MDRILPIYILVDCSESMKGEPIEAVHQGISALINDLRDDPQAIEMVHISIITFADTAMQLYQLTELMNAIIPSSGGSTHQYKRYLN